MYIPLETADQMVSRRSQQQVAEVLRQFLPIQVRTAFIVEPTQSTTGGRDSV